MSLKAANKIDTNRYELEIEVGAEEFGDALEKAYQKNVININIKGFRKGKAPRAVIERIYGDSVFYEDAVNIVYPTALSDAIKEAGLEVVGDDIDFNVVFIGKEGLVFKAGVTTKPEVELDDYKSYKCVKKRIENVEQEVESEIARLAERNSRLVSVEGRPLQKGDIAVFDFEGFLDGTPFEGGKAEGYNLEIGSGNFIPGFEDQMVGHNAGEEFDITVTFPEDYGASDLAGKESVFKIKLHEIKAKEMPQIDDEFAKDVSEFDTLEDMKNDIREKVIHKKEHEIDDDIDNQLIEQIIGGMKAEIPEVMFEKRIDENIRDFEMRLNQQGLGLEQYLQYVGMEPKEFRDTFRPQAERQVKLRLALEKIAELENIQPTEEDLNAEYQKLADMYKLDVERVKLFVPREELLKDIAVEKAVAVVRENAKIVEEEVAGKKETKAVKARKSPKKAAEAKEKETEKSE